MNLRNKTSSISKYMTSLLLFSSFHIYAGESQNDYSVLHFDASRVSEKTQVHVFGKEINYSVYNVTYALKPTAPGRQVMSIYIPDNANNSSPVFIPLTTENYLESAILKPSDVNRHNVNEPGKGTSGAGASRAAALALSKGMVVASPATRGPDSRDVINGKLVADGNGPAPIIDLKAAIRYLKFNDTRMKGDANLIVISGTGEGGQYSSVIGSSGNSSYFDEYLEEIGSAPGSDSVFAVAPYCPDTDIDNANISYEYFFGTADVKYSGGDVSLSSEKSSDKKYSTEDVQLANALASMYPMYINALELSRLDNLQLLTLDENSPVHGNYFDLVVEQFNESATEYFIKSNFVREDGSINQNGLRYMKTPAVINGVTMKYAPENFLRWDSKERRVIITNWKCFLGLLSRLRPVTAFDNGYNQVTDEMRMFSEKPAMASNEIHSSQGWNHFDPNLQTAIARAGLAQKKNRLAPEKYTIKDKVSRWAAMMNPMYYLMDYSKVNLSVNPYAKNMYGSGSVAPFWHIRVGSFDSNTSPLVSMNLALALAQKGVDTNYRIIWNQPHTGNYDNPELIEWIMEVTQYHSLLSYGT